MHAKIALAVLLTALSLAPASSWGAEQKPPEPAGIKKGTDAFSGMIRGTVRVDGSSVWIDQLAAAPIRVATDSPANWADLNGKPVAATGDFMLFNGTPTILIKHAMPRRDKILPQRANIDVRGRVHVDAKNQVLLDTHDGLVRVANPEVAQKLRDLGLGVRVKARGALSSDNQGLALTVATWAKVEKPDGSHRRGGKELDHPKKVGKAGQLGTTPQSDQTTASTASAKTKRKHGFRKSKSVAASEAVKTAKTGATATAAATPPAGASAAAPAKTNVFGTASAAKATDDSGGYDSMPTPYLAGPDNQDD